MTYPTDEDEFEVNSLNDPKLNPPDYGLYFGEETVSEALARPDVRVGVQATTGIPANKPLDMRVYEPVESGSLESVLAEPPEGAVDIRSTQKKINEIRAKVKVNEVAEQMLNQPMTKFEDTPRGLVKELVMNQGKTVGQALDLIQKLYNTNNPYVKSLPGIDQFVANMPGTFHLMGERFARSFGTPALKMIGYTGDLAEKLGYSRAEAFQDTTVENVDFMNKFRDEINPPNPWSGWVADMAGELPYYTVAGAVINPLTARLVSKVFPGAKFAAQMVREGRPLTMEMVAKSGSRAIRWLQTFGEWYGQGVAVNYAYGREDPFGAEHPYMTAATTAIMGIGSTFLFNKMTGRTHVNEAIDFLANATGKKPQEVSAQITHFATLLNEMKEKGAPEELFTRVINEGRANWGDTFGLFLGKWARATKISPEEFKAQLERVGHKGFQNAAFKGYNQRVGAEDKVTTRVEDYAEVYGYLRALGATDDYIDKIVTKPDVFSEGAAKFFGRQLALTAEDPAILYDLTRKLRHPRKWHQVAADEYNATMKEMGYDEVNPLFRAEIKGYQAKPPPKNSQSFLVDKVPQEFGGAQKYYPPGSRWYMNKTKERASSGFDLGGGLHTRDFLNPVEVNVAEGQLPAYALIEKFQSNRKMAAAVLKVLENRIFNKTGIETSLANEMSEELANRLARRMGYDSIIYKGPTPDRNVYVDLTQTTPLAQSEEELIRSFEQSMQAAGRNAAGKNFLSIALPVGAGLAALAATPGESQAAPINFGMLKNMLKDFGEGPMWKFLQHLEDNIFAQEGRVAISSGERMALQFAQSKFGAFEPAEKVINKLEAVHELLKEPWEPTFQTHIRPGTRSYPVGRRVISIEHPTLGQVGRVSYDMPDSVAGDPIEAMLIEGVGASAVGPSVVKKTLKFIKELPEYSGIRDDARLTGVAERGKGHRTATIKSLLPLAVGAAGLLYDVDDADAAMIKPVDLRKLIDRGNFGSFQELLESGKLSSRTGNVLRIIRNAIGMTDIIPTTITPEAHVENRMNLRKLVGHYDDYMKDLQTGRNLKVLTSYGSEAESIDKQLPRISYPGVYEIYHPLGEPFPIGNLSGAFDPHSGTWYIDELNAQRLGFGKQALKSMFEQVKKIHPEIIKLGNPRLLAGILAASYAAYDYLSPRKAEAAYIPTKPILDELGQGMKGAGDSVLQGIKASNSVEDLINFAYSTIKGQQQRVKNLDLSKISIGEHGFITFDNAGKVTPETEQLFGMMHNAEGQNSLFRWRMPWSVDEHPAWQASFTYLVKKKDNYFIGDDSTKGLAFKALNELEALNNDLTKDQKVELTRALHGLKPTRTGWLQTAAGISPRINNLAIKIHDDPAMGLNSWWHLNTGINPKAIAIMEGLGLPQTKRNWRMIRQIQLKTDPTMPDPHGSDVRHTSAALQMGGMINTKPWQWKNLEVPYQQAKLLMRPKDREIAVLEQLLKDTIARYGKAMPVDVQQRLYSLTRRLQELKLRQSRPTKKATDRIVENRFAPFDEDRDIIPEETVLNDNPFKVLQEHIDGSLTKAFFDEQNHLMNTVTDFLHKTGKHDLADYIKEFMNALSGTKAYNKDAALVNTINSVIRAVPGLKGKGITLEQMRTTGKALTEYSYYTKLGMGLRFPIVNTVQPLQTTATITGFGPVIRAYAKVMNDPAIRTEALGAKVMRPGISRAAGEIESTERLTGVKKILDFLPEKSENFNRVVAYQAAKDWVYGEIAKTGTVKVPHFVRGFDRSVLSSGNPDKIAKEVAQAVVKTTQFMFGPEGRPLFLTGGSMSKVMTQFKSFTAGYVDLMIGTMEHAKRTGDIGPLVRGLIPLLMFGGVGSLAPGTGFLYDLARNEFIKRGYNVLPRSDESGLGYMLAVGASTFGQPDQADELKKWLNILQLSGSFSMMNLPNVSGERGLGEATQFLLGPTLGPAAQIGLQSIPKALSGELSAGEAGKQVLRAGLPPAANALEALQASGVSPAMNEMLSALGYRGGIYSDTGKLLARQQPEVNILARALNLTPSPRSQRYKIMRDIQTAYEGGQTALAEAFLQEARAQGFIFTNKDIGSIKGNVTRKSSRYKPNEPLQ